MEVVKTYEFSSRGNKGRYDLDKLLDGKIYRLKRGEDFANDAKIKSVRGYIGTQAGKRGLSLRAQIESDDVFVIQAYPRTKPAKTSKSRKAPAAKPTPADTAAGTANGDGGGEEATKPSGVKAGALA